MGRMPWSCLRRLSRSSATSLRSPPTCASLIKEGKTLEDATKTAGFEERDAWKLFDHYHVRNVTAAFAELEWE